VDPHAEVLTETEREMRQRVDSMEVQLPAVRVGRLVAVGDGLLGEHGVPSGHSHPAAQLDVLRCPPDERGAVPEAGDPAPELLEGGPQRGAIVDQLLPACAVRHQCVQRAAELCGCRLKPADDQRHDQTLQLDLAQSLTLVPRINE